MRTMIVQDLLPCPCIPDNFCINFTYIYYLYYYYTNPTAMKRSLVDTDMSPPNSDQKHDSNEIRKNHESKTVRVFSNKHQTEILCCVSFKNFRILVETKILMLVKNLTSINSGRQNTKMVRQYMPIFIYLFPTAFKAFELKQASIEMLFPPETIFQSIPFLTPFWEGHQVGSLKNVAVGSGKIITV